MLLPVTLLKLKLKTPAGMVTHTFIPSTWKVEVGRSL